MIAARAERPGAGRRSATDLARHLAGADVPERLCHRHAAPAVPRHHRREPQRGRVATATWVFPLYLVAINLFVLPSPSPACRWSAPAPAPISMCCRCRCSIGHDVMAHGSLHRWAVGGNGHGDRRKRGAVDHDLQRPRDSRCSCAACSRPRPPSRRLVDAHPQCPARGDLHLCCSSPSSTTARAPTVRACRRSA